jgi:formate dehydrogenase subunit gamma
MIDKDDRDHVLRYSLSGRLLHWAVALAFILLFVSGLALFHPYFYWIASFFGGGSFMRLIHPYIGAALALLFFIYAAGIWRDNLLLPTDRVWLRNSLAIINKEVDVRVDGKYNAGQKVLFWLMLVAILGLLASGFFIWRPYFAPLFTVPTRRIAVVVHVVFAFVMFVEIGIHIYAAIWTSGSISGMIRGYVSRAWARFHYAGWYSRVEGAAKGKKEQA